MACGYVSHLSGAFCFTSTVAHNCHGKTQFITAKYNLSRQNTIHHGKIQFETTNSNYSRQTPNTHGKSKNNNCNSKFIKARAKHSRQKQIKNGGQRLMVSGCPSTWCSASKSTRRKHDVDFPLNFTGLLSAMLIVEEQGRNVLLQLWY